MTATRSSLKTTPLYSWHLHHKARMVPFAGFEMPVQYRSVLGEAVATRKAAGLFDVSHMGQLRITGKDALGAVNRLVTNRLEKTTPGQAQYNLLCNEDGGVIDDLVVYHVSQDEIFICLNAANRHKDVEWFQSRLPASYAAVDESEDTGLIALQGPKAQSILSRGVDDPSALEAMEYFRFSSLTVFGAPALVSRTGYTGEDGFEIYAPADRSLEIWEGLMEVGSGEGLEPIGLGARDTLRTEMGYPLHGQEISPIITPLQAGLGWACKVDKDTPFVGQEALKKEKAEGPAKRLIGFRVRDRRQARPHTKILVAGEAVGEVTSGTYSPHTDCPIGLGYVPTLAATEELAVEIRGEAIPIEVCSLPFVPPQTRSRARVKPAGGADSAGLSGGK